MVDRIRALLAARQLTPTQFADLIQVGRPIVSHILSGRNKASLDVVQRIMAAFPEVALPWLLSGSGPMLAAEQRAEPAAEVTPSASQAVLKPTSKTKRPAPLPTPLDQSAAKAAFNNARPLPRQEQSLRPPAANTYRQPPRFKSNAYQSEASNATRAVVVPLTNPSAIAAAAGHLMGPKAVIAADEAQTSSPSTSSSSASKTGIEPLPTPTIPAATQEPAAAATPTENGLATPGPEPSVSTQPFITDKPIRRIVIFYRDGSFSDFQPEN